MKEGWYIFTFGAGQLHEGHYVKIYGTYESAREEMIARYGKKWCMQYPEKYWDEWVTKAKTLGVNIETELK